MPILVVQQHGKILYDLKNSVTISFVITDVLFKTVVALFKLLNNFERFKEVADEEIFTFEFDTVVLVFVVEFLVVVFVEIADLFTFSCFATAA